MPDMKSRSYIQLLDVKSMTSAYPRLSLTVLTFFSYMALTYYFCSVDMNVNQCAESKMATNIVDARRLSLHNSYKGTNDLAYKYHADAGNMKPERAFSSKLLENYRIYTKLDNLFDNVNEINFGDFVFVTAASAEHYKGLKVLIRSIQIHRPSTKIYVFDLGMTQKQVRQLLSMCSVIYHFFTYNSFPGVEDLRKEFYKPMIIAQVLMQEKGVFWIDPALQLKTGDFWQMFKTASLTDGFVALKTKTSPITESTRSHTAKYFPNEMTRSQDFKQYDASAFLVYRTRSVYENIIRWWFICSVDRKCILPQDLLSMCQENKQQDICSTYSESILNVLLWNHYGNNFQGLFSTVDIINFQPSPETQNRYRKNIFMTLIIPYVFVVAIMTALRAIAV